MTINYFKNTETDLTLTKGFYNNTSGDGFGYVVFGAYDVTKTPYSPAAEIWLELGDNLIMNLIVGDDSWWFLNSIEEVLNVLELYGEDLTFEIFINKLIELGFQDMDLIG